MLYKDNRLKKISFPVGGIGSGSIGVAGNGALVDWEIFNRPSKNTYNGYTHFAIKACDGERTVTKVLMGDTCEDLMGMHDYVKSFAGFGFGPHECSMAGYPHFRNVEFNGRFPVADLKFSDGDFPATVHLTVFNPFIPHDDFNSSLPAAFFGWEIENVTNKEIDFSIAFSVQNPAESSFNEAFSAGSVRGVFMKDSGRAKDRIGYSDLCVCTDCVDVDLQPFWYRGRWQDGITTYWKNFSQCDRMPERIYAEQGCCDHCTVCAHIKIAPGGREKVKFVLSWNVPNQYNYWNPCKNEDGADIIWKNYYATRFASSAESAKYALANFDRLCEKTVRFADAIQQSTLPEFVKDAVSANLSVLRSPVVMRLEDGSLWGWEGVKERDGSCEGSCQHVWNYAYALPFLFPRLERSLRENTMKYALRENGSTCFRVPLPLGRELSGHRPCVDGQMGEVIKCYREWKISGDDNWLKEHSSDIFKMLEFAWSEENVDKWDADRDGVIEGRQHHTLDMELFGPNSWLEGFYLLALDCASEMADVLEEWERAEEYRKLYKQGREFLNEKLFCNGYFSQQINLSRKSIIDRFDAFNYWNDEAREIKYQIGEGCEIDQMLSDWHAVLLGRKGVFDDDKKRTALENLYKNNYKESMRDVTNMWRNFAVNDEGGTIICSYPEGAKVPAIPIPYCEECMTGFEYALAGLMIANGMVCQGETMVKSIRDRYDGEKRNPWNELECGSNYARSMASFALMNIYSGFSFDMRDGKIGFAPVDGKEGVFLWSVGESWGTVRVDRQHCKLDVLGNPIYLRAYSVGAGRKVESVLVDGREIDFSLDENGEIHFDRIAVENELVIN